MYVAASSQTCLLNKMFALFIIGIESLVHRVVCLVSREQSVQISYFQSLYCTLRTTSEMLLVSNQKRGKESKILVTFYKGCVRTVLGVFLFGFPR